MNRNSEQERCNDIDEHHADALFRIRECIKAEHLDEKAKHLEENGVCEIDGVRRIAHQKEGSHLHYSAATLSEQRCRDDDDRRTNQPPPAQKRRDERGCRTFSTEREGRVGSKVSHI